MIIVAPLWIIASCLLFGPHATLIMIIIYGLVILPVMTVRRFRERREDPMWQMCRAVKRQTKRERLQWDRACVEPVPAGFGRACWIFVLATTLIVGCVYLGTG